MDVRQERSRFPNLFSAHALVPRFDSIGHLLEEAMARGVDLDGNVSEVHLHVSIGRIHPEAWRR
jgi:hypothetical protein